MSNHKVISQHVQDCFLYLCILDTNFLKMARTEIKPSYFSSQVTEDIVKLCYGYFDQFRVAPENHLYDELVRSLSKTDEDKKSNYYTYLERINQMDAPNKEYITSSFNKFIQARQFEESLMEAAPLVERGDFDRARQLMQKACKAGITSEEEGICYPGNWPPTYYDAAEFKEVVCPTGIPLIDKRIMGLRRSRLTCIFGGYKVGKTWGCTQIAVQGLIAGRKVLTISHEATAAEIEMRHDMMLGSLVSGDIEEDIEFCEYDAEGKKTGTFTEVRDTVFNPEAVGKVRARIQRLGGEVIIKKYPMATCTIGEIERYLDYLETHKRFIPDLLINDYVEKMKLSKGGEGRDAINDTYMGLKRIGDERNISVVTASQIKTEFLEKSTVSEAGAPAEDARKLGNIDLGLFFGASRAQAVRNLMQAYVLVNRFGPQKFGCVVSRNLAVGQFVLDCWPIRWEGDNNGNNQNRSN